MTAVDAERDARLFFDAVYATKPERSLIAVGPYAKPHCVYSTDGALPYVVGQTNAFVRVTLLPSSPSAGGAVKPLTASPCPASSSTSTSTGRPRDATARS